MITSNELDKFATDLSKLQGEIEDVTKTKEVKSKDGKKQFSHAELSGVLAIARPLLSKYGFSIIQMPSKATKFYSEEVKKELYRVCIDTKLLHSSGQWVHSLFEVEVDISGLYMSDPQKIGTVITYLRRYVVAAMLCIAQVDDESELIVSVQDKSKKVNNNQNISTPTLAQPVLISSYQIEELKKIMGSDLELIKYYQSHFKVDSLTKLTNEQYFQIKDDLRLNIIKKTEDVNDIISKEVA